MTTPTDDRPELLTVIAYMRAAEGETDELLDGNGLTITRLKRLA